jgi:MoxR-like ATPase
LDTYRHDVPDEWRILATLNDRDRDLLFDIPYALLRRFAVIQVPNPPTLDQRLLDEIADTGSVELNRRLAALTKLPHRSLQRMTRTWGEAQLLS